MKKTVLILMLGVVIIASNLFAADGDLIVEGNVGIGTTTPVAKLDAVSTDVTTINTTTTKTANNGLTGYSISFTDSANGGTKYSTGLNVSLNHTAVGGNYTQNFSAAGYSVFLKGSNTGIPNIRAQSNGVFFATPNNYTISELNAVSSFFSTMAADSGGIKTITNASIERVETNFDNTSATYNITNLVGFDSQLNFISGSPINVTDTIGFYARDPGRGTTATGTKINVTGVKVDKQTRGITNMGIWLNGDGAGADLVLGANRETKLYGNSGNLIVNTSGSVGIGTTTPGNYKLYVNGSVYASGGYYPASDERFKKDITAIESPLSKVLNLKGIAYDWKTNEYKEKGFDGGRHYGVIGQEVEKVLPEIVKEDPEGYKGVAYTELIPILIEAVKEQQKIIEELKMKVQRLEARDFVQRLKTKINRNNQKGCIAINNKFMHKGNNHDCYSKKYKQGVS